MSIQSNQSKIPAGTARWAVIIALVCLAMNGVAYYLAGDHDLLRHVNFASMAIMLPVAACLFYLRSRIDE